MMDPYAKKPKGFAYKSLFHFMAERCRTFSKEPLTAEERELVLELMERSKQEGFKEKACFMNAQSLMMYGEGLGFEYAEGYATSMIPVQHAWVVLGEKPIDVTWRDVNDRRRNTRVPVMMERVEHNLVTNEYFGLTVPFSYIKKQMLKTKLYTSVIDCPDLGHPLLRKGFSFDA